MVVLKEVKSMFWALFLEPGKRYSQKVEHAFHISMAALEMPADHTTLKAKQNEIVGVMVGVDKGEFLLSSLNYKNIYQQPLDLNFYEGEEITFFINGEGNVHLTGYVMDDDPGMDSALFSDEDIGDSDEQMSDEEVPELVPIKSGKRKKEPVSTPTKKQKKTKWIDDEAEEDSDEDSEDMDSDDELNFDSFYDENDDEDDDDEESEDEKPKKKNKSLTKLEKTPKDKQKSQDETKKSAKKDKNKVEVISTPKTPANEAGPGGDGSESSKKKKKKKKKNKDNQDVESTPQQAKVEPKTPQSKTKPQQMKKQVLSGGTVMEEVHSGEGPVAKPGKMVHVYYVGKLQKNGKQFDSCTKGKPFRFRLGASEVIKGWDAGVAGMKVGGKRRLIVPPQQAYGSQGVGGIPPNSTLVFEVELKNIS